MEDVLTEEALGILAAHGKGLPRLLNRAATLAFNLAAQAEADSVDAEVARSRRPTRTPRRGAGRIAASDDRGTDETCQGHRARLPKRRSA